MGRAWFAKNCFKNPLLEPVYVKPAGGFADGAAIEIPDAEILQRLRERFDGLIRNEDARFAGIDDVQHAALGVRDHRRPACLRFHRDDSGILHLRE